MKVSGARDRGAKGERRRLFGGFCVSLFLVVARTLGPREERSVRATAFAAWMLAFCASIPRIRLLVPCSCGKKKSGRGSAIEP